MKTNKSNTNQLPTTEDFAKIQSFTHAVIDCNSVMSLLQNHFELLKRVGDNEHIMYFKQKLLDAHLYSIEYFKSFLTNENED